jgi:ketosteroid isomerase-like protein
VTETSERAVIRQLEDRRYAAIVRGDYDAFRELCHPDLAYTHSTGISDSLDSYLAKCTQGFYDHHRIDHPIRDISIFGDVALVLGEMRAVLTAGGVRKQLDNVSLAVWVRDEGGWRLRAYSPTVKRRSEQAHGACVAVAGE